MRGIEWKLKEWRIHQACRQMCIGDDAKAEESGELADFSDQESLGACPKCRGFGRVIDIDYGIVMPDHSRTLEQGVVKPWLSGVSAECQEVAGDRVFQHGRGMCEAQGRFG